MGARSLIPDLGIIRIIPLEFVLRVVTGHVLVALFPEKNPANPSKVLRKQLFGEERKRVTKD